MSDVAWIIIYICILVVCIVATWFIAIAYRKNIAEAKIGKAEVAAREIIDEAQKDAEAKKREILLEAKEDALKTRNDLEKRVLAREESIDRKTEAIEKKEASLASKEGQLEKQKARVEELQAKRLQELERISGLTSEQAKEYLLKTVEDEVKHETAVMVKELETRAKEEANKKAKEYVVNAIQRCAVDHISETTISLVQLPNDEMKGRIIGREGRNIRTLETLTGVDLIIDDTPEAVILSSFDPVRREVARIALEKLIVDGRIHPARIEEMVEKAQREVEAQIREDGENAAMDVGVHGIHPELLKLLGRMKFRSSYGQNALRHSIEVAQLSGMLAGEVGVDVRMAKRAGLLHDIGIRYITTKYENQDWEKVDPVEVFEYKKHTIMGFSALEEESWVPDIARKMVLSHHERMNGSGFPMRQKNRELECKIIQACDAFDCYISGMECKLMSVQNAIERITDETGTLFDKKIVKSLLSGIAYYPVGTTVEISNGEKAVVISQTDDPKNPIVLIADDEKKKKHNLMLEKNISILQIV